MKAKTEFRLKKVARTDYFFSLPSYLSGKTVAPRLLFFVVFFAHELFVGENARSEVVFVQPFELFVGENARSEAPFLFNLSRSGPLNLVGTCLVWGVPVAFVFPPLYRTSRARAL